MGEVPSPVRRHRRRHRAAPGWLVEYMRAAFDCARSRAFVAFLDYAKRFPGVWFARRVDIARWWLARQPPALRSAP